MKKTGLQKNIAFIFDGADMAMPNTEETAADTAVQIIEPPHSAERSDTNQRLTHEAVQLPPLRPQPIPKKHTQAELISPKQAIDFVKTYLRTNKPRAINKQQKNLAILVVILAVAFVGVLIFVLGSSPARAAAAAASQSSQAAAGQSSGVNIWKKPEAYHSSSRDPMKWSSKKTSNGAEGDSTLVVRGIVYSQTNPSAIISGQIVRQGEMICGVKILAITKDYVEFEKDKKQWKQQVEK